MTPLRTLDFIHARTYDCGVRRTAEEAAQTRAALLDAALFLFAEHGVASTKLAEVAQRAGLTRGAVYHHFADKTDLYAAVMADSWETTTAPVWAILDTDAPLEERLSRFLVTWLRRLVEDDRFRALLTVSMNASYSPDDPDGQAAKARGLGEWGERLETALSRGGPGARLKEALSPAEAAGHLLAWLCGTALLAATDPALLPPGTADGVSCVLGGILT